MARTLSIDLAYTSYEKFGICLVEGVGRPPWHVEFVKPSKLGLSGNPAPAACASQLAQFCAAQEIDILLLDGPQGWKDPGNPYPHSRSCERELHCPAKTGVEGRVKPANYRGFVEFSISLFTTLANRWGMTLLSREGMMPRAGVLLVEVFPHAAWKELGLPSLPAKHRCSAENLDLHTDLLSWRLDLDPLPRPSHDELQALASAAAGPALARNCPGEAVGRTRGYRLAGLDPRRSERGYFLEGLIALPRLLDAPSTKLPPKLSRRLG